MVNKATALPGNTTTRMMSRRMQIAKSRLLNFEEDAVTTVSGSVGYSSEKQALMNIVSVSSLQSKCSLDLKPFNLLYLVENS